LYDPYARAVLTSIHYLWGKEVMLATKDKDNDEYVYVCVGNDPQKDVALVSREDYEKTWI
jgi:spore cortex formation protein SpoVR/YcgB (stage V sporulation)